MNIYLQVLRDGRVRATDADSTEWIGTFGHYSKALSFLSGHFPQAVIRRKPVA
jgi:hypothetical protein